MIFTDQFMDDDFLDMISVGFGERIEICVSGGICGVFPSTIGQSTMAFCRF